MATSPTPARLVVASSATSEATIQQLLGARTKLARRALALKHELLQRSARERREFSEQAAQQIHAADADFDTRVVEPLAARLKALDDNEAKATAMWEALRRTSELIEARLNEIKDSPERDLLARELGRERQRLEQERAERQDESDQLDGMIERIDQDLHDIGAAVPAAAASKASGTAATASGGAGAEDAPEAQGSAPGGPGKDAGGRKQRS